MFRLRRAGDIVFKTAPRRFYNRGSQSLCKSRRKVSRGWGALGAAGAVGVVLVQHYDDRTTAFASFSDWLIGGGKSSKTTHLESSSETDDRVHFLSIEEIHKLYAFKHKIGEGGYSIVFEGRCKKTGHLVAIKRVTKAMTNLSEIKDEIAIMKQTGVHPNLVSLRAAYETDDAFVLILDLVKGGEVFEHVVERGSLTEDEASLLFQAILRAISHMHRKGIVHSDLKPENLLLTACNIDGYPANGSGGNGGLLKVADFGESYFMEQAGVDDLFGAGTVELPTDGCRRPRFKNGGTPCYWSPERVRFEGHSAADDVWATGVCLYIMLCGSHPFDPDGSQTEMGFAQEIGTGHFDTTNDMWRALSPAAQDLISRMLDLNLSQRIRSVAQVMEHPWVTPDKASAVREPYSSEAQRLRVSRLTGFRALSLLRRGMLAIGVSPEDLFTAIDISGDGLISLSELHRTLVRLGQDFTPGEIQAAIDVLDTDHDKKLSLSEFRLLLARPLVEHPRERNENALSLFRTIDNDGNGLIDFYELSHLALLIGVDGASVHALWARLGKSEGDSISFHEFLSILENGSGQDSRHEPEV